MLPSSLLLARTFWLANLTCLTGPLPSPKRNARPLSPTDPVPAGPRTAGRPRTRHLARKLGILDAQNTRGSHTPPPSPFFACDDLTPRSSGLGGLGGRSFARVGCLPRERAHGMIEPTRQRPRHRDGLPRAARICGGRLPRCRATAVLPPSGILAKMRLGVRFGKPSGSALEEEPRPCSALESPKSPCPGASLHLPAPPRQGPCTSTAGPPEGAAQILSATAGGRAPQH